MRAIVAFVLLALPLVAADLAGEIKAVIDSPSYKGARWGILVVDTKTGQTVYARNADTFFAPASVTKLFSCAAALVALGPDHKFETPVYALGKVKDGNLTGDLVLVASGDLTFGGRTSKDGKMLFKNDDHIYTSGFSMETELTDSNPVAAFDELAKQVKAAGITSVNGDVLIDDRLFIGSEGSGSGPRVISPMIVNDSLIDLIVTPGKKAGDPATLSTRPETAFFKGDVDIATTEKGPSYFAVSNDDPQEFSIRGRISEKSKPMIGILPVRRPTDFARTLFIEALRREGVRVTAALVRKQVASELPKSEVYAELKPTAKFISLPFKDAITVTLKVSHNLYASTLPHLTAAKKGGGRSIAEGLKSQGDMLKEIGLDPATISFGGGAGGSNADHVTPRATVTLLEAMQKRPEWSAFKAGLPVLGVDGTLASVVGKDSPAKGHVFAKTGTLSWGDLVNGRMYLTSKALGGVMTTKNGKDLTFAIFLNDKPLPPGVKASAEGKTLGKLCEIIYENGP